ncbi:MAG: serine/threonine-protein kinase [Planctomycetota bacterium]
MPAPKSLGPYKILKTIGRGGMGTVYSAIDSSSGDKVAVKLIAQGVADDPRFRDRFKAEIISLARLEHPGIVKFLHSHIDEEGQIFYSMEIVEGETLQALLRREKKIGWSLTIEFAIQVCSALKHAHDAGVIHRDLKPANLILTESKKIKLIDFGIAKLFGDTQQTHAGSVLGTADYMAPEQAGTNNITPRTDLYALGNVMYAMLAGRPPFTGKNATEVIDALKRDRVTPIDLIEPQLPDELVELVHQLLEKDPSNRPPTALVVMKRLQSMQAGLQRFEPANPDEILTHVPESDPAADTSSTGLRSDPVSATDEINAENQRQGTVASQELSLGRPTAATVISRGAERTLLPDGSQAEDESGRYEAVTDFHLTDSASVGHSHRSSSKQTQGWQHWIAVTLMLAVLASGAGLFWYAMQPPSADELYGAAIAGDIGSMSTFLRRFPEDARFAEIQSLQRDARLASTLKRLSTQASIGISELSAAEEGFVVAMNLRLEKPSEATEKLQQWLTIYDGSKDSEIVELIELAKHEQIQIERRSANEAVDPRAEELLARVDEISELDDKKVITEKLRGLINMYGDVTWANPAVERAREQLRTLNSAP